MSFDTLNWVSDADVSVPVPRVETCMEKPFPVARDSVVRVLSGEGYCWPMHKAFAKTVVKR